jgi:hypothetical protein
MSWRSGTSKLSFVIIGLILVLNAYPYGFPPVKFIRRDSVQTISPQLTNSDNETVWKYHHTKNWVLPDVSHSMIVCFNSLHAQAISSPRVASTSSTAELLARSNRSLFAYGGAPNIDWIMQFHMYSTELSILLMLQTSPYVASNASEAKIFFVPQYSLHEYHICVFNTYRTRTSTSEDCRKNITSEYMLPLFEELQQTWHWKRNGGRDHVFVFPHDHALDTYLPEALPKSMRNILYFGYHKMLSAAVLVAVPL